MTFLSEENVQAIEAIEADAWEDMVRAAPFAFAEAVGLCTQRLGKTLWMRAAGLPLFQFNWLSGAGLYGDDTAAIQAAAEGFRQAGIAKAFIQIPASPRAGDMQDVARRAGLCPHPLAWAKFHRATGTAPEVETHLSLYEVGPSDSALYATTTRLGFGMPALMESWLKQLPGRPNWHCYVAFDGDHPIGAAALYVRGSHGWLGIGATRPDARKRGSQTALLARRIADAARYGAKTVTTETGVPQPGEPAPSYANIGKAGFRVAYVRENWTFPGNIKQE